MLFALLSLFSPATLAQTPDTFPIKGMTIRLIPASKKMPDALGIKIIDVEQEGTALLLKWSSEVRKLISEDPWPEYRIMTTTGQVKTPNWKQANTLFHPALWVGGSFNVEQTSLLWLPLGWLKKGIKEIVFEPGFLSATPLQLNAALPALADVIRQFQELAAPLSQKPEKKDKHDEKNLKKLENFIATFTHIHLLDAKKSIMMAVNGEKRKMEAILVGNAFVEYLVLNNPENPLVVSLSFNSTNAPPEFKPLPAFFHDNLEFRITQIQIDQ